jgi:superfamily I DNA/RNA helicase
VHSRRPGRPAEEGAGTEGSAAPETPTERGSIVEALDDLGDPSAYSAAAWRRLRRLGAELGRLRGRLGDPLPDLVDEVARTLGLETELASAPGVSPAGARAHLDALHAVAAEFTELAELPSLPAFLGYLRDAEERERGLEPGEVAVNPEAVQLLTGHSAKGLEWDVVHVLNATDGNFPSDMALTSDDGLEEERRLFYVAMTRPRRALHVYSPLRFHYRPRGRDDAHTYGQPSRFLSETVRECFDAAAVGHVDDDLASVTGSPAASVDLALDALWS